MFKKLLSISLIFLIAVGGLTSVSSAKSLEPILMWGYEGEHYQAAPDFHLDPANITQMFYYQHTVKLAAYALAFYGDLSDDGVILKPLNTTMIYPYELPTHGPLGYVVKVSFQKRP